MIKRDRRRPHLGKRTVQSSPRKTHPVGRNMCEVEEESKQGGRFRGRKEDEATLEDPVQEESDSKSESHVIEAFLTDGHNSKPLSCGKESILARMALWMLSFSWPCLIPLSDTFMMLVLAMHCAVLLVGPSVHPHIRKKGRKRGARAMAPLQVPHDNLLVVRLPEDFSDFSDSLATNEVSSTSIDQPCPSCSPVPLPRSAPLRPAAGHPHLFEFFFATTVTALGGLCCPSWRLSRKPCARHRIFCSVQESSPNPRHCCRQRTTRPRNQQEGHVTRTLSLATAMWMLSSSEPRSIPFSETYMMSVWACIAPLFVMSFVTLPQ